MSELATATVEELARAVAARVVELLRDEHATLPAAAAEWVDASRLAAELGVSRDWVYAHATELGAIRLGDGPRGRLRFDISRALAAQAQHAEAVEPAPVTPAPRRRASARAAELLPIHGRRAA